MDGGTYYPVMGLVPSNELVALVQLMTRTYDLAIWFNKTIKLIEKMN
jgi:hypothetical protein